MKSVMKSVPPKKVVKKSTNKTGNVQQSSHKAKSPKKTGTVQQSAHKAKSPKFDQTEMTLEEKLDMWKQKQDFNAPLELNSQHQKQLSGQFKTALAKANADAKSVWTDALSMAPGLKQEAKQTVVKSWIMDKNWGQSFIKYTEKITQDKAHTQQEKPRSMKELESKYTADEINDLLETGGITICRHSLKGRVKMYIDHSNWARTTTTIKQKSLQKDRSQDYEPGEDGNDCWTGGFNSFNGFDEDQSFKFFLADDPVVAPQNTKGNGKGGKGSGKGFDFEDDDKAYKAALSASTTMNAKKLHWSAWWMG